MKNRLSDVVSNIDKAMSIKYNTIVYELQRQGKDVTVMSLGEAFFDIPLFPMESLPFPNLYHYTNSSGIPELREKLAEFFLKEYEIPVNYENEILITAGSKAAIHFAFMSILNPGDEVIVPEPAWVSYPEQIKLCYAEPVSIPYYETVYDYEKYITSKTKAIIICNPHNPTGYVFKEEELVYLLELAEKYKIWILSDEAYSEFISSEKFVSPGKLDKLKKNTIIFNSISKNYGISGWRLGYVIANEQIISNILKVNQHLITCPATILEYYVDKYFYDILEITKPQIKELMQKRKLIADFMDTIGIKYLPGSGTFYFFVSITPSFLSSEEFCSRLLFEKFISVVPGIGYGKSCDSFVRVSIGTASLDSIKSALASINELITTSSTKNHNKHQEVLVVAGGLWQKPLINFLKEKGHIVSVVDPYLYSEGVMIADKHIKEDVKNIKLIYEKIKNNKYAFITTDQSDISVNTVSLLSEQLNLKSNPYSVTNTFVNKYEMRNLAKRLQIDSPDYSAVNSLSELKNFITKVGLPIIIKPADSQSSRGVTKIDKDNIINIEKYFIESLRFSSCGYIVAEQFIEGYEITAEGFASNYKHRTFAISRKNHFRTAIASSLEYPAVLKDSIKNKIENFCNTFVENSGLKFGITHAEFIIDEQNDKAFLLEIACRGGGTLISSHIINHVTGQNIYELLYQNLMGNITPVKDLELLQKNAILQFFEFPAGKVKEITGLETAKNIKGVLEINLSFRPGDTLKPAEDDRSRQGFVILFADSKQELDENLKKVINSIQIKYF